MSAFPQAECPMETKTRPTHLRYCCLPVPNPFITKHMIHIQLILLQWRREESNNGVGRQNNHHVPDWEPANMPELLASRSLQSARFISSPFACAEILNASVRGNIHKGMTVTFVIINNWGLLWQKFQYLSCSSGLWRKHLILSNVCLINQASIQLIN